MKIAVQICARYYLMWLAMVTALYMLVRLSMIVPSVGLKNTTVWFVGSVLDTTSFDAAIGVSATFAVYSAVSGGIALLGRIGIIPKFGKAQSTGIWAAKSSIHTLYFAMAGLWAFSLLASWLHLQNDGSLQAVFWVQSCALPVCAFAFDAIGKAFDLEMI